LLLYLRPTAQVRTRTVLR